MTENRTIYCLISGYVCVCVYGMSEHSLHYSVLLRDVRALDCNVHRIASHRTMCVWCIFVAKSRIHLFKQHYSFESILILHLSKVQFNIHRISIRHRANGAKRSWCVHNPTQTFVFAHAYFMHSFGTNISFFQLEILRMIYFKLATSPIKWQISSSTFAVEVFFGF